MSVTLQIKRSTGSSAPGSLSDGELAYTKGDDKLYIGGYKQSGILHYVEDEFLTPDMIKWLEERV